MKRNIGWSGIGLAVAAGALAAGMAGCASSSGGAKAPKQAIPLPPLGPVMSRAEVLKSIESKQRPDDFDRMVMATDLDGQQLGTFMKAVAARYEKFAAWEQDPKKGADAVKKLEERRTAAKAAGKTNEVAAISAQLDAMNKAHREFRKQIRAEVCAAMTLAQQKMWVGVNLGDRMKRHFGKANLTEAQAGQVSKICAEIAAKQVTAETLAQDPYLSNLGDPKDSMVEAAVKQIAGKVLTPEQQKAMAPPAPAAKK